MADGFSRRKDQYGKMGQLKEVMKDAQSKFETEKARLEKKINDLEELLSKSGKE
jgi:U3 small nucleolar ribonucleoprotein component